MAYAMTKQGSLDNCVTYEFICDTVEDMNAIENRYRTIGTVAIVLQGASGDLEVYIAGSNKQWNELSGVGSSDSMTGGGLTIHICTQDEVTNGVPSVSEPDESTVYLVANNGDTGNLYDEFIYVDDAWEKWGSSSIDLSGYAPIANPEFTGSISLNRKTGTTAGTESIAVGNETAANGPQTVAFGRSTISNGDASFTCGSGLVATGGSEFVIGTYNKLPAEPWQPNTAYVMDDYVVYHDKLYYCASPHTSAATFEDDSGWYHARKYLLTIGNGNNSSGRGNAFVVDIWGDAHLEGDLYVGCDDDSQGGTKVATVSQIPDVSTLAPKNNPVFTNSISMGRRANTTVGANSTALGVDVEASGVYSFAEGAGTNATYPYGHAEGTGTTASGVAAHAEGTGSTASNSSAHAEGNGTTASNVSAHSEGTTTTASGYASHAEGLSCTASQSCAHAEGNGSISSGNASHAEGMGSKATAEGAHAEGGSQAHGNYSHAEGVGTVAEGAYSHAGGIYNVVDSYDSWTEWEANTEYVIGDKVKVTTTSDNTTTVTGYICKTAHTSGNSFVSTNWITDAKINYAEIVGNGSANNSRSNARALDWDGNERLMGDLYVGCASDSTGGVKLARIAAPSTATDGTYTLQATVSSGVITYSWVAAPTSANGVSF